MITPRCLTCAHGFFVGDPLFSEKQNWPRGFSPGCAVSLALAGPALLALFAVLSEEPHWQSGELSAYATLVLRNSIYVFAPLMLYSTICLALAAYRREAALAYFVIRFGVYSGILLSVQPVVLYLILAVDADSGGVEGFLIFAGFMALGSAEILLPLSMAWVIQDSTNWRARWTLGISAATLIAVTLLIGPALFVVAPVVAAPLWTIVAYVAMSRTVYRRYGGRGQFRLVDLMGLLTWSSVYLASWRLSVTLALEKYATLPKTPPRCYVCTAAARGHRWLVQPESMRADDGKVFLVNRQMRRLKGAELVLLITVPWLHRVMRVVYDRLGPPLARRIEHPLAADFAYLALKPVELLAIVMARQIVPRFDELCQRLYANTV